MSTTDNGREATLAASITPSPAGSIAGKHASGDMVAGRFVLETIAGKGGMGLVYRASDRTTGERVAVKLLEVDDEERFLQEARLVAELAHPAIVRYIAHGTSKGQPFFAMEWLDGVDLGQRLRAKDKDALSVAAVVTVLRGAAAGLAVAHARGIIHRDIKPANLFLVGGEAAKIKVLDFGIARRTERTRAMTRTGALLGTVGYMAPEQASGASDLDARADIFSLGCVAFECLTGEAAFAGVHPVAVLAKLLAEDARGLAEMRPDLPAPLCSLVDRMLARERGGRPADAATLLAELESLGPLGDEPGPQRISRPSWKSRTGEQRLVSVILTDLGESPMGDTMSSEGWNLIARAIAPYRATLVRLANGTLVVTLAGRGPATDRAALAAACALALRDTCPGARIALATGHVEVGTKQPVGSAIDRAAALLADPTSPALSIDDVTAGLVDSRFEVEGNALVGVRESTGGRALLGRATPCVGREKELALLAATFAECVDEPVARAIVVTAAPGVGKSRLRDELVSRVRDSAKIIAARADPVSSGSSLDLVRQLVVDAAPRHEFLRELVGPRLVAPSPLLRAARDDARLMAQQLQRDFEMWLGDQVADGPTVVVLEDLHWSDAASVKFVDGALAKLRELPLMVVALARPEVHDTFPNLWSAADPQRVQLSGLTKRAAEKLVEHALGKSLATEIRDRIVARAEGNAYYLEELIRRVAAGSDDLPETILAMVQSRLDGLEVEARLILRAASVFGETFRAPGVAAVVLDFEAEDVAAWLRALADREVLSVKGEDYTFRHGLLRDAAYATLTEDDRVAAHRRAAAWLVGAGAGSAMVIADHFERGDDRESALPWLAFAARDALDSGNVDAARALAERGIAAGATGEMRGTFLGTASWAHQQSGEFVKARELLSGALDLLEVGGTPWFTVGFAAVNAGYQLNDPTQAIELSRKTLAIDRALPPTGPYARMVTLLVQAMVNAGMREPAMMLEKRLEAAATGAEPDPMFTAWSWLVRVRVAAQVRGDLGETIAAAARALDIANQCGDLLCIGYAMMENAWIHVDACALEPVIERATAGAAAADRCGSPLIRGWCELWHAKAHAYLGDPARAIEIAGQFTSSSIRLFAQSAWAILAVAHLSAGRAAEAEHHAKMALANSVMVSPSSIALAVLSRLALDAGDAQAALAHVEKWRGLFKGVVEARLEGGIIGLAHAEALHALGRTAEAQKTIALARDRLYRMAGTLEGTAARERFLEKFAPHQRTLVLADAWS